MEVDSATDPEVEKKVADFVQSCETMVADQVVEVGSSLVLESLVMDHSHLTRTGVHIVDIDSLDGVGVVDFDQ